MWKCSHILSLFSTPSSSPNCLLSMVINTIWLPVTLLFYRLRIEKFTRWLTRPRSWDEHVLWCAVFHAKLIHAFSWTFVRHWWNYVNISPLAKSINVEVEANARPKLVFTRVRFCVCDCSSQSTSLESSHCRTPWTARGWAEFQQPQSEAGCPVSLNTGLLVTNRDTVALLLALPFCKHSPRVDALEAPWVIYW